MTENKTNPKDILEIKLITGELMEIRIHRQDRELIMAFTCVFNMQWRLNYTGVLIQKGINGGSLKFMPSDGVTYQNFFIDADSVDKAIAFFKSWGFKNCAG